jgi:hypothetical protein
MYASQPSKLEPSAPVAALSSLHPHKKNLMRLGALGRDAFFFFSENIAMHLWKSLAWDKYLLETRIYVC